MKLNAILLCAGYATRLYPLTKNFPKPLLEVGGKPVISHTIEKLEELNIEKAFIVTNSRYYPHFIAWREQLKTNLNIEIIDDDTSTEETKLGAIADIHFVIEKNHLEGPLLIIAGDNLFDFSLKPMYEYFTATNKTTVSMMHSDAEKLKKGGAALLDEHNRITHLEEKPLHPHPQAKYANCIYFLDKESVPLIATYLQQGNNPDQPGSFIQWLYPRKEIHGFLNTGRIIDIGTPETLAAARASFTH